MHQVFHDYHGSPTREATTPGRQSLRNRAPRAEPAPDVKALALVLMLASAASLAAGDQSAPSAAVPQTDIRKELLAAYKFEPRTEKPPETAPFLAHAVSQPEPQDLVDAAPQSVRNTKVMNHLHAAVLQEQSDAKAALVASELGIGIKSVRVGKNFALGAVTVFYIPVAIGGGFAW